MNLKAVSRKVWKYALANYDSISDSLDSTKWDLLLLGEEITLLDYSSSCTNAE